MTVSGPELILGPVSYNCRLRVANWAREQNPCAYDFNREFVPDRRVPDMYRFSIYNFDPDRHVQLSLLNVGRESSGVVAATSQLRQRYLELDAYVAQLPCVELVSGTAFSRNKKILYTEETSGAAIPHMVWRAVLCHWPVGRIKAWAFALPNIASPPSLESCALPLASLESMSGLKIFEHICDASFERAKLKLSSRWW